MNDPAAFLPSPPALGEPIAGARLSPTVAIVVPPIVASSSAALWLGIRTEIVFPNVDAIPDAQPLVEITNASASGAIAFGNVGLTRTQLLVDPSFASNAVFIGYLTPVIGTIVRASAGYVWIWGHLLNDPLAPYLNGIMIANNDGSLHAFYHPQDDDANAQVALLGLDPVSGRMWGCASDYIPIVYSMVNPGAPSIAYSGTVSVVGWDKHPTTMMFVGGKLYVGCGASRLYLDNKIGIFEWNPTVGVEAFVQETPNPLSPGATEPSIFVYSAAGDEFFSTYSASNGSAGATADFFQFDRATLTRSTRTLTEIADRLPPVIDDIYVIDVTWNAETDKLWFLAREPLAEGDAFRLLEVARTGGAALRSLEITWLPAGTPAGATGFLQHGGKLYVRAYDIATDTPGVCVVDMASGVTEFTHVAAQTDFPWAPPVNGGTTNFVGLDVMAFV